jgi:uncharacterized YccA/Bax inhibitor family protein
VSSIGNLKTGNPAFTLAGNVFDDWAVADRRTTTMTVAGTAAKAVGLLIVLGVCAAVAWTQASNGSINGGLLIGSAIGGLVLALATCFKPTWAPVTAPLYAACEGFFLGALSNFLNMRYPGIASHAVTATFATALVMFVMYTTRMIRVTPALTRFIVAATGAFFVYVLFRLVMGLFGIHFETIQDASWLSIGISAIAIGLASLNLLLDFDFIENQSRAGAPKTLEWYGAFALMVTLIWLYIEMLRLLAKLSERR